LFSYVLSDADGYQDLGWTYVLFNETWTGVGSCMVWYAPFSNQLYLADDAGAWMSPMTPGTAGTLQNTQCTLNVGNSSVDKAGTNMTFNLDLTFHQNGTKTTWLYGADSQSQNTGWAALGTWTVSGNANQPPTADSVTPSSGSGPGSLFSYVLSDADGYQDLGWTYVLFNETWTGVGSCMVWYAPFSNALYLTDDAGNWTGPMTPGTVGTLQNTQCTLNVGNSSVDKAGTNMTLNLDLTFHQNGTKTTWLYGADSQSQNTGWAALGTWTVSGSP
jgi:hypothetical protein